MWTGEQREWAIDEFVAAHCVFCQKLEADNSAMCTCSLGLPCRQYTKLPATGLEEGSTGRGPCDV